MQEAGPEICANVCEGNLDATAVVRLEFVIGAAKMTHCVAVRRFLHLEHTGEAWSHLSFAFLHGSHAAC